MKLLLNVIFYIYLNFFTLVNSNIIINPIIKENKSNLFDYYISFENYNASTFGVGYKIIIDEENDLLKFNGKSFKFSPNIFICRNQNNKEFLFAYNHLYIFNNNSNGITSGTIYKNVTCNCTYYGYMKKQNKLTYPYGSNSPPQKYHNEYSLNNESIILYGINDKNIFFYFSEEEKTIQTSFDHEINIISCNFLDYTKYLCAFDQDNIIQVTILSVILDNSLNYKIENLTSKILFVNLYPNKIILYDTNKGFRYKILCANNLKDDKISCLIISIDCSNHNNDGKYSNCNINIGNLTSYNTKISKNEDNCYLTKFMSEFLLCCGMKNQILCERKNIFFETINNFAINLTGEIYNLTITNNESSAILSYMNNTQTPNYLYEYYIYPPECPNFSNYISDFNDETIILFEKKTNTKYYITFIELPSAFGISKINGNNITELNEIEIKEDVVNFTFPCYCDKIDKLPVNLKIKYNISILETYSTICEASFLTDFFCKNCPNNSDIKNDSEIITIIPEYNGNNGNYCTTINPSYESVFPENTTKITSYHIISSLYQNNFIIDIAQNKCIIRPINQTLSSFELKSQLSNNMLEYLNLSCLIDGPDFLALVLYSNDMDDPKKQINKGISAVNLGNCEQVLKEYYNISQNESLIILNMESKRNEITKRENNDSSFNLGKRAQIEVYDFSGKKLNLSLCNDIKILKYLEDVKDELNFNSAANLANKGIDVFNAKDSFFNDLCHKFDIEKGKDIILTDRRNDFYQNASFCEDGCLYNGIDYDLITAIYICNSNFLQGDIGKINDNKEQKEILNFENIKKSFISHLFDFNIEVIYCYNLVFDLKRLKKNIGFYFMFIILILQIIFLCIFLIKKLNPIKNFMLIYSKYKTKGKHVYPPKKNNKIKNNKLNKNHKIINNNIFVDNINSDINYFSKRKSYNFSYNYQNGIRNSKRELKDLISYNNKDNNNILYKLKRKKNSQINKYIRRQSKKKLLHETINDNGYNEKIIYKRNDFHKLYRTNDYLLDMEYEVAIIKDKSSFLRIYCAFLVDSQIILGTFCTENYLDLFVIKLSFLVSTFEISFFLNALFYSDDYISDAYHNNGVLDFVSGLPKSIYSFIATLITTNLLRMLSNSKSELMEIIIKNSLNNNYIYLIKNKLIKLRNKIIIYFILVFLLGFCFLYYVSAFCAVYIYSQKYWFLGCLESFAIDSIVAIVLCLFLSFFRFIAIKKRIKCLYILSNILSAFL